MAHRVRRRQHGAKLLTAAANRILVTGSTGLIGSCLVAEALARGVDVRAAVRSGPHPSSATSISIGDIGPNTDWAAALDGCDTVVHLAAVTPGGNATDADLHRANVLGTRRLVDACLAANVRRLIFASSIFAVAERSGASPVDDTTLPAPSSAYGRSKLAAEAEIARFAAAGRICISLRPPLIYDARAKGNFSMLLRLAWSGLPLPFGSISNRRSLVGLDNLVDAILAAALAQTPVSGAFCIDEGPPVGIAELIAGLRSGMRIRPRLLPVDSAMLRLLLSAFGLGRIGQSLLDDLWVDGSRFKEKFKWTPLHASPEGIEKTGADFLAMRQSLAGTR